jgi:1,4-dihydroxy-2-naphthoyl-CoA hydrolase
MTNQNPTSTPAQNTPGDIPAALANLPPAGDWIERMGLVFDVIDGARVTAHLDLGPEHHTPWGVVHGGVYTTLIESVASVGASAAVFPQGQFAVGVNNSTDFLRSTQAGRIEVVGEPIQQGRVQQLWQVSVTRAEDGKLIAQGRVRLQNVPLPPTAGAAAQQ